MLKHILLPLDGSELAEKAIIHTTRILDAGSRITLLIVIDTPETLAFNLYALQPGPPGSAMRESAVDYQHISDEMMHSGRNYLEGKQKALQQQGYQVDILAEYGAPADVIVETAERLKVDAIAISTHGRSGLSRWILGSVTSRVISAAPCPVYVIPPDRQD